MSSERTERVDSERVKTALGRLAGSDSRTVIERAALGIDDLTVAAEFVECVGLEELELAIERTDDRRLQERGERALTAYHRFRAAAAGDLDDMDHFHRGRGTHLRDDAEDLTQ